VVSFKIALYLVAAGVKTGNWYQRGISHLFLSFYFELKYYVSHLSILHTGDFESFTEILYFKLVTHEFICPDIYGFIVEFILLPLFASCFMFLFFLLYFGTMRYFKFNFSYTVLY
jgi:hypothetical protein